MQIKRYSLFSIALLGMLLTFNACKKNYESIENIDEEKIKAYLTKNNIQAIKDSAGFYYQILEPGTNGVMLNKDSVFYTATLKSLNNDVYYAPTAYVFDANYLGYVSPAAFRQAMYRINRGGKIRLIIPSYLAFGKNGQGNVPSNEIIVSDISVFPETTLWQLEDRMITRFLADKNLTGFTRLPSGIYRNISTPGTGDVIRATSTITVKYKGRLLDGTVFDESGDTNLTQALSTLISGWKKTLIGLQNGVKLRVFIPSDLGYGKTASGTIPANSILDFDIEVTDVTE